MAMEDGGWWVTCTCCLAARVHKHFILYHLICKLAGLYFNALEIFSSIEDRRLVCSRLLDSYMGHICHWVQPFH